MPSKLQYCVYVLLSMHDGNLYVVWARTLCQDLFFTIVQGDWRGLCKFGQEVEGLEAAAPRPESGSAQRCSTCDGWTGCGALRS